MAGDGVLERLDDHLREHRGGIVTDLLFAVAWVTLVNALFRVVDGPTWAYYLFMAAGVVALRLLPLAGGGGRRAGRLTPRAPADGRSTRVRRRR